MKTRSRSKSAERGCTQELPGVNCKEILEQEQRILKIAELIGLSIDRLNSGAATQASGSGVDSIHLLIQTLQWQLGLAMVNFENGCAALTALL